MSRGVINRSLKNACIICDMVSIDCSNFVEFAASDMLTLCSKTPKNEK